MENIEFVQFRKIPRLSREMVITEKIDGTNGLVYISNDGEMRIGSRNKWINTNDDNHGFAAWCLENSDELLRLGPGYHFGEWWGYKIQRGYGLKDRRFSLFNVKKWGELRPACCDVVPVLYSGPFSTGVVDYIIAELAARGSSAAPGFNAPEGVVVYHTASGALFKKTIKNDDKPKGVGQ